MYRLQTYCRKYLLEPWVALGFLCFPVAPIANREERHVNPCFFPPPIPLLVVLIRNMHSGVDGPVREPRGNTLLLDRFIQSHKFKTFQQRKSTNPHLPLKARLSHLGIAYAIQTMGAGFSFNIHCEVSWTLISNSKNLRAGQGMKKNKGLRDICLHNSL